MQEKRFFYEFRDRRVWKVAERVTGGERWEGVHERVHREVRDLPILDTETVLLMERRRLECPECGPSLERLGWLERYARVTKRLAEAVARLCQVLPVKQVGKFHGLGWETVKDIHKSWLHKSLGPVDLSGVRVIGMDEFAIQKGHRYATGVVDALTRRVLWVGRGRGREDVRAFFDLLGALGCAKREAVAMDMNGAYEEEVRERPLPAAHERDRGDQQQDQGHQTDGLRVPGRRVLLHFFLRIRAAFLGIP